MESEDEIIILKLAMKAGRDEAKTILKKHNLPDIFVRDNVLIKVEEGKETIIGIPEFPTRRINPI